MVRHYDAPRRRELLLAALEFVRAASRIPGVLSISLVGSICTERVNPKDVDFLVRIADDVDFVALSTEGRRLKGCAQQVNRGADIFLARAGKYIGRICHYRECWPRRACTALHCGLTQHLNDDLETVRLSDELVNAPPVTLWPAVKRRADLPADVEAFIAELVAAATPLRPPD